jgi:aldose 1-epimerase
MADISSSTSRAATAPLLALRAGDLALDIAPASGGIIAGFRHRDIPLMRAPDAAQIAAGNPRGGASWPLVPYSNRIRSGRFPWLGDAIELARDELSGPHAIHGDGWRRAWTVLSASTQEARIAYRHPGDGFWPFAYAAEQRFALTADGFRLGMSLTNLDTRAMPAGLGHHPYFRRARDTRLAVKLGDMWLGDEERFPARRVPLPAAFDFSAGRSVDPVELDAAFLAWERPARIEWPDAGLALDISADDLFDRLIVFIPPGQPFFAVEPVSHDTDAVNRSPGTATGLRVLAPGETLAGEMRFDVGPLEPRPQEAKSFDRARSVGS